MACSPKSQVWCRLACWRTPDAGAISTLLPLPANAGVREKNTPPEKDRSGKTSFQSIESGAGLQLLLLDCTVEARVFCCSQTPLRSGLVVVNAQIALAWRSDKYLITNIQYV